MGRHGVRRCPSCDKGIMNFDLENRAWICSHCGNMERPEPLAFVRETPRGSWKCTKCGFNLVVRPKRPLRFCPKCGTPILGPETGRAKATQAIQSPTGRMAQNLLTALADEIEHLRKEGGSRTYTIRNGEKIARVAGRAVYRFDYDGDRIDDDVPILLQIGEMKDKFPAEIVSIVGQEITLSTAASLPEVIPKAKMFADPVFILERLHERISSSSENFNLDLALKMLGERQPRFGKVPVKMDGLNPYQGLAVEKSAGSEVFFIWGPPGTGKTTTISAIVTSAFGYDKTVLITSNTNVAVDNAIAKAEKQIRESVGYIPGDILRVGIPQAYVPREVLPEDVASVNRGQIEREIAQLDTTNEELLAQTKILRQKIKLVEERERLLSSKKAQQRSLADLKKQLSEASRQAAEARRKLEQAQAMSRLMRNIRRIDPDKIAFQLNKSYVSEQALGGRLSEAERNYSEILNQLAAITTKVASIEGTKSSLVRELNTALARSRENTSRIAELRNKQSAIEKELVAKAKVVGTTLAKCWLRDEIYTRKFDLVVVDEASMATLPMLYFAAGLGRERILIAGDFKQIPAIVLADTPNTKMWMKRNIFEVAGVTGLQGSNEACEMLRIQYRMNPDISRIVSTHIYNGLLQDHESVSRGPNVDKPPGAGYSLIIVDTSNLDPWCMTRDESRSRINLIHLELAIHMAKDAVRNGFTEVGIITPYRAQARLLARRVEDEGLRRRVEVATVHRFQGREKQVVIFDISDSKPYDPSRLICTSRDKEKHSELLLNVAVSRAQDKLIMIGNIRYLEHELEYTELVRRILADCDRDGLRLHGEQFLTFPQEPITETPRFLEDGIPTCRAPEFYSAFESDLRNAKEDITIVSAFVTERRVRKLEDTFRSAAERGVAIRVLTKPPEAQFEDGNMRRSAAEGIKILRNLGARVELNPETHEKICVIDNSIVWYGSLNILSQYKSSETMMRFVGENAARQLLSDAGLPPQNVLKPPSFAGLKDGMRGVTVTGRIAKVEPIQYRRQRGGASYRFAHAILEAEGHDCKLTLWGAETELVREGVSIRIVNGYTKEYNGEVTLQSGKFGKIEILES